MLLKNFGGNVRNSELWQAVLGEIELSVSRASFVTWFKNTCLLKRSDELLVVGVSNVFIKQQFEHKFNDLVVGILKKNGVEPKKIEYKIYSASKPAETKEEVDLSQRPQRALYIR
jgi:chromosomal replication initiator protein